MAGTYNTDRGGSPISASYYPRRDDVDGRGGRGTKAHEPARKRDEPVSAPARPQPGRLVSVGSGRADPGAAPRPPDLPVDRLRSLPLVSRHGARVVRGRGDRDLPELAVHLDQGRPGGAPRPRP